MATIWIAAEGLLGARPAVAAARPASSTLVAQAPITAGRRVALLVGVADYQHFVLGGPPGRSDLLGPEHDVDRMRATLRRWGFVDTLAVHTLKSRRATRAAILAELEWVQRTVDGDSAATVVVYFSGHGSRARDGGDQDETDGLDEALVPADARDPRDPSQLVLDDEVRAWLGTLVTRNVTVIIDACFSGTMTRGEEEFGRSKGPLPDSTLLAQQDHSEDFVHGLRGHTLLTAAASDQRAIELPFPAGPDGKQVWFGVLTYHLTRVLDGAAATRGVRYAEVVERLAQEVLGSRAMQTPQLEGDAHAVLFRVHQGIAERQFSQVVVQRGDEVVLDAGAIHGVRRTAVYDVFADGELAFAASARLAHVRIDSVHEARAFGHLMRDDGTRGGPVAALPLHARAVPALVPMGVRALDRLSVHVDPSARDVDTLVRSMPGVEMSDASSADATVTRRRGALEVLYRGMPLPPLRADTPYAVVVRERSVPDRRGRAASTGPQLGAIVGYPAARLCTAITRAFAIRAFAAIQLPQSSQDIQLQARLVPTGSGPPDEALVREDTAFVGRTYDVYVRVRVPPSMEAGSTLYLSAAIEGFTSRPTVLWPRPEASVDPVPPNRWLKLVERVTMVPPTGIEYLKVVAGDSPYSLRSIATYFNQCNRQRDAAERGADDPNPWEGQLARVTGWQTLSWRLVILPAPR